MTEQATYPMPWADYLRHCAVEKSVIDAFLDPAVNTWAQFNSDTGYTLYNYMPRDGIDGSATISTAQSNGARTQWNYTDKPCRLNTYGNSFTQCHQVSDGETWQEYLAAHFGEPIQNFGMGGYGVFQSYRRMVSTEATDLKADNILWYIYGDDHYRSIMRSRFAATRPWWHNKTEFQFHNNFWCNYEMNLETGVFEERDNLLATPESVYQMCNPDYMYETLKDDYMVHLVCLERDYIRLKDADLDGIDKLADCLQEVKIDRSNEDSIRQSLTRIQRAYGFTATKQLIDKARAFAKDNNKSLSIALFCPGSMRQLLKGEERWDQRIPDYLKEIGQSHFDMSEAHLKDYQSFKCSIEEYCDRYFIGHYSPIGNHFFAFSIKDHILNMLDPKPITYQQDHEASISFQGYLDN